MKRTLVLALALVALACAQEPPPEQTVQFLFYNGKIVTRVPAAPEVEAVAVKDGRIVDIGTYDDMHDAHAGVLTRMIDLRGGVMVPGVVEPPQTADVASVLAAVSQDTAAPRTIAIGEPADFVVFNHDPAHAVGKTLTVMKVVRGGETVYRAGR